MPSNSDVTKKLTAIYKKYLAKYPSNPDSKQMCCMWSTDCPPDVLEITDQVSDLEEAFDIEISEDEAFEIYDMMLDEAVTKIQCMIEKQRATSNA